MLQHSPSRRSVLSARRQDNTVMSPPAPTHRSGDGGRRGKTVLLMALVTATPAYIHNAYGDRTRQIASDLKAVLIEELPHALDRAQMMSTGAEVRVAEEVVPPGGTGPWRTYPASATIAYVLEGRLRLETSCNADGAVSSRDFAAGEAFIEPATSARHSNPDRQWATRMLFVAVGLAAEKPTFDETSAPSYIPWTDLNPKCAGTKTCYPAVSSGGDRPLVPIWRFPDTLGEKVDEGPGFRRQRLAVREDCANVTPKDTPVAE